MIYSKEKITSSQCIPLLISTTLGVGILSLPRYLVDKVKGDGFIVIIMTTLLCLLIGYSMYKIITYFPHKSFLEINSILLSKPIGYIVMSIYFIYYISIASVVVRVFVEVMKMYMLSETPTELILITMLFVCAYSAREGIEAIGRLSQFLLFLIILPIIGVYMFALQSADFTNIMPILDNNIMNLISSISLTLFSFSGFEILLIIGFFLKKPKEAFKIQYMTLISIGCIYLFFTLTTIAVFGQMETSHLFWPTLTLVKIINLPGSLLENLDAVIMGGWMINIFMSLSINFLVSSIILGEILDCKETNYLPYPLIPIIYVIAIYPSNLDNLYNIMESIFFNGIQILTVIVIPIILFALVIINKKIKKT